ncbi:protein PIF-like isoform X2 [Odontomachus brunneus]|uniref:protein PIF-like isoform X2 n=1 Tax=Odontomachus brunneus TaxID=486640 RepID=UPI0013F25DAD|nr:protein PIF-like isoform X2 [Odontomachus brunneus]
MKKQKEISEDTDKLLSAKNDSENDKHLEKKYRVYNLLNKICVWIILFAILYTLYICYENYKKKYTIETYVPKIEERPITTAFVDSDTFNEINRPLEDTKFIKNSALTWDKKNEIGVSDVMQIIDVNSHPNFLKKLIKISLDRPKHANKKINEHKQLQDNPRSLQNSNSILDLDSATMTSTSENSKEYKNDIDPTHNPFKIKVILHHRNSDEELISSEKHTMDDLIRDDKDRHYDVSKDFEKNHDSDKRFKFLSKLFYPVFDEKPNFSKEHAINDFTRDDGDSYYDVSNDSEDDYISNIYNQFLIGPFRVPAKRLNLSKKLAIDDFTRDDGDSHYDVSDDSEDDYVSDEHDQFSSELFHRVSDEKPTFPKKLAIDDFTKDDGDSHYDVSDDSEDDYVSDEHDQFSSELFHRVSDEKPTFPKKLAIDDFTKDDGDSHYDVSDDSEDDYVSDS